MRARVATKLAPALLAIHLLGASAGAQWVVERTGSSARLRGISAVDSKVAWASGTGGTVLKTVDGGATWNRKVVPGAESSDFRDIEAFDARTAYVLSIGAGKLSRIYKTSDGGSTWALQHSNPDPTGFLDALAFWDSDHGLALGDPVGRRFVIFTTDDSGKTWTRIASDGIPAALTDEGAFAASGTCLVVQGDNNAWFATGAGRVFRSADRGRHWTVHQTPIRAGNGSAGIFSLTFWDADHGAAVGGDYKAPDAVGSLCALSSDGGRTWRIPRGSQPSGYRSAVTFVPGSAGPTLLAAGPTGTDQSTDGGDTWTKLGGAGYHALSMTRARAGWAVGDAGRIAHFETTQDRRSPR
jgi:photosystem II stability/assembly factor-like uncharacterized protein